MKPFIRTPVTALRAGAIIVTGLLCSAAIQAAPSAAELEAIARDLGALGNRIERLEDLHEVETVQHAYGYYVDKAQWKSLADLFDDDATLEIGGKGVFLGKQRVYQYMNEGMGAPGPRDGLLIDHQQFQCLPSILEDGVSARQRCIAFVMSSGGWGHVYYENAYRKENGVWKFEKLHGPFNMYSGYRQGWIDNVTVNTYPEKFAPYPDLPPTVIYLTYPSYYAAPFHYPNPVTGKTAPPPSPRAGGEAFGR
jgi:hypothetical protein